MKTFCLLVWNLYNIIEENMVNITQKVYRAASEHIAADIYEFGDSD